LERVSVDISHVLNSPYDISPRALCVCVCVCVCGGSSNCLKVLNLTETSQTTAGHVFVLILQEDLLQGLDSVLGTNIHKQHRKVVW